jgi:hypothetical protein
MNPFQSESFDQTAQIAEHCFSYLVGNPEELSQFMQFAGLSPDALRKGIGTAELNAGMLDYFVQNESALMAMCANAGLNATHVMNVWQRANKRD